jgi:predicted O-methyltransferase YrrM
MTENDNLLLIKNRYELSLLMRDEIFLADSEIALLARYATQAEKTIVEIGAAFGASSSILALHSGPGVTVHSIDPFVTDSIGTFRATEERCSANVEQVLRAFDKKSALVRWKLHKGYSYDVVANWNILVDMIFIDGDHRYEAVRKDFDDWFPHVRSGGFVLLHDSRRLPGQPDNVFRRGWPGPTQLACELEGRSDVRRSDETASISVWVKL